MSFAVDAFDKVYIPFPYKGMNRDIAPHLMPEDYAWFLENMTQDSLGNGMLRFGIKDFAVVSGVADGEIMRAFPFIAQGGKEQLLLYMRVFHKDASANTIKLNKDGSISFKSTNRDLFYQDTKIKIVYKNEDDQTVSQYLEVTKKETSGADDITLTDAAVHFTKDFDGLEIYYTSGEIYKLDVETKVISKVHDGLRVDCIPRAVSFVQKLVLCNGLDLLLEWDGQALVPVAEWVKEKANGFVKVSEKVLEFQCDLNADKYLTQTSAFFNSREFQIANKAVSGKKVTLTLLDNIGNVPTQIFFRSWPPRCNFLYVAQDRLWGLGEGAAGIGHRSVEEAMLVYRTDRPNLTNSWIEEETQRYRTIDLSNKHGVVDNLESIAQSGSRLVFVGREKTQVYEGQIGNNSFSWQATLSTGTIHGDLVFELANDIFFVNAAGLHSFSTLNIGNQFAASSITAVNSLLKEQVVDSLRSNSNYRSSFSFLYGLGSFLGIRIGDGVLTHALYSTQPNFFSRFSGEFDGCHIVPLGNRLFLLKGKKIATYADGRDGTPKGYSDFGNPIVGAWQQPFNQKSQGNFACYRASCLADYANSFVEDEQYDLDPDLQNGAYINIFSERPRTRSIKRVALLPSRKEELKGDVDVIEFDGNFKTLSRKLKTFGTESWLYFSVVSHDSYFSLKQIILYGRRSR